MSAYALYPNYAVPPSPYPRRTFEDLTLIAADSAERFSGLFIRGIAVAWGFRHLAKDAQTLAVELVTRAVETTGNPNPRPRLTELSKKRPPNIGIRVTRQDHGLIEVWDSDPTPPQDADAHLATVANVSQDWGCYRPRAAGRLYGLNSPCRDNAAPDAHVGCARDPC
ncbi:MAG: hypothetical protein ACRDS9_01360 [Pseudonocardiaceae bacterium]